MKAYQVDYTQHKLIKNRTRRDRAEFALNLMMFIFGASLFLLAVFLWSFI